LFRSALVDLQILIVKLCSNSSWSFGGGLNLGKSCFDATSDSSLIVSGGHGQRRKRRRENGCKKNKEEEEIKTKIALVGQKGRTRGGLEEEGP